MEYYVSFEKEYYIDADSVDEAEKEAYKRLGAELQTVKIEDVIHVGDIEEI